ncbi:MAG: Ig-like domain-containing protein [Lachnospiraceae bacterium]|nr:Ig-like domain-containing protein [Lachnospiraceae bacterium]
MDQKQQKSRQIQMPYINDEEEELFDPLNLLGEAPSPAEGTTKTTDLARTGTSARNAEAAERAVRSERVNPPAPAMRKKNAEYANAPTKEVTYETDELPVLKHDDTRISEEPVTVRRPSREGSVAHTGMQAQRKVSADGRSASGSGAAQRKVSADGRSVSGSGAVQRKATADGRSASGSGAVQRKATADGRSVSGSGAVQRKATADGWSASGNSAKRKQSIHMRDAVEYDDETEWNTVKKKKKSEASFGERISAFFEEKFASFTKMDWLVCGTGVVILLAVIVLVSVYFVRMSDNGESTTTMEDVGHTLADLGFVGESGLLAISDAQQAKQPVITPEADGNAGDVPEEEEDPEAVISVRVSLTSVEKDLKVKFTNSATGKLINNAAFRVTLTPSSGSDIVYEDDDMDGIIYHNAMTPGTYGVKVEAPERYEIVECASSVQVRDTIVYERIEVADEIKTEAEVNVALEDTQMNAVIEQEVITGTLTDTVEWVESTKTTINNDAGYSEIPKSAITDPTLVAGRTFYALAATNGQTDPTAASETSPTDTPTDTPSPTPTDTPTPSPTEAPTPSPTETPTPSPSPSPTPTQVPTVSSVTVKGAPTTDMTVGNKASLTAEVSMSQGSAADCTFEWKSSDANVVSVSGNGSSAEITAKAAGSAKITVTVKTASGEKTAECTITVKAAAAKTITLDKTTLSMQLGTEQTLTATLEMTDGTKYTDKSHLTWSSSDTNVVKVDDNGKLTPVGAGTAKITVTSKEKDANGNMLTVTCDVTVSTTLSVKLDKEKVDAYVGTKLTLIATVVKNGTTTTSAKQGVVTWTSSDKSIATVDEKTGEITPIKEGTVTISATTVDKDANGYHLTVSCTVTVKKVELSIKLDKEKAELFAGAKLMLVATVVKNGTTETSATENWVTWTSSDTNIATVNEKTGEVTGVKAGTVTITATTVDKDANGNHLSVTCTVTVKGTAATDTTTKLKDANGNQVFIKNASGSYVEATLSDYYTADKFYIKSATQYKYTGWQTIDNATYFFDKNGNYVTGKQVIQGVEYTFANNGVLSMGNGTFGIDVSKWNGNIDWNAVKSSGVTYVIIRCGFRGSTQGALIEDAMFRRNIEGAQAAGIQVGVYFYTQAVNEVEAVEEASMVLALVQKYRISYPIFIDTEASGGRADRISKETRTAVCRAFCETIRNAGYTPGIYASKSWFNDKLNTSSLSSYKIWLAQYATKPTYTGRYDLWQYSDKGTINGISGKVDVNYSYLGY